MLQGSARQSPPELRTALQKPRNCPGSADTAFRAPTNAVEFVFYLQSKGVHAERRSVAVDHCNLRKRATFNWTEAAFRIANRHQRKSRYFGGQTQNLFNLVFRNCVIGRQYGSESEGATRQDYVLHSGINAGARCPWIGFPHGNTHLRRNFLGEFSRSDPEAREQQYWGVAHVVVKVKTAAYHAVVLCLRLIVRFALMLVPLKDPVTHSLIDPADSAPLLNITHHHEKPVLPVSGIGRLNRGLEYLVNELWGNGIGLQPAHGTGRIHGFEQSDFALHTGIVVHGFTPQGLKAQRAEKLRMSRSASSGPSETPHANTPVFLAAG